MVVKSFILQASGEYSSRGEGVSCLGRVFPVDVSPANVAALPVVPLQLRLVEVVGVDVVGRPARQLDRTKSETGAKEIKKLIILQYDLSFQLTLNLKPLR
jgi:hypothetical protein